MDENRELPAGHTLLSGVREAKTWIMIARGVFILLLLD
jgi:hypothetical protein